MDRGNDGGGSLGCNPIEDCRFMRYWRESWRRRSCWAWAWAIISISAILCTVAVEVIVGRLVGLNCCKRRSYCWWLESLAWCLPIRSAFVSHLLTKALALTPGTCGRAVGDEALSSKPVFAYDGGMGRGLGCEAVETRGSELCFLVAFLEVRTTYAIACAVLSTASLWESTTHSPVSVHFFMNLPGGSIE